MSPQLRGLRNGVTSICLAALLLFLAVPAAGTAPLAQPTGGEAIFEQSCAGCHSIGGGPRVGPDLEGVGSRRDAAWLARFISEPGKVLAEGDPTATALLRQFGNVSMPALGLAADQVQAVIAYLETAGSGPSAAPAGTASPGAPAGDAGRGKALFAGTLHLEQRGTPCLGCHSAGKTGLLGGGVVGPDLTAVAARYGSGLQAALAGIPWPTMSPIYSRHPLTPQEQADLLAFFQSLSGEEPVNREWAVAALSVAGAAGALAAVGLIWRRRLRGVRRQMVEQARSK